MICSRETIPHCVVCEEPTMIAGADDRPWSKSYDEQGWVCSERCELRDRLASADPSADWGAILDSAYRLGRDHDVLIDVRIFRAACEPVEGCVVRLDDVSVTIEDYESQERDVLLGMIERVEVIE